MELACETWVYHSVGKHVLTCDTLVSLRNVGLECETWVNVRSTGLSENMGYRGSEKHCLA